MTCSDDGKTDSPLARKINDSRRLACEIARLIEDRRGRDVVVLELAQISPVALHFVIGTGTSEPQIRAIAREAEELGKTSGYSLFGRAGTQQGRWVVVDFVDVVLHLFDEEYRSFYDLELLWGDAPKIDWQGPKTTEQPPKDES